MHRNLRAWFLQRLDSLLTPEQRRLPPDELSRLRVLVGAAALNFALALLNMFGPEAPAHGTLFRAAGIFFSASYLSTLILVRRGKPIRIPAMLLCSTLAVGLLFGTHLMGTQQAATHAANMLVPALAVYLLGARLGFLFAALMALNALFLQPLSMVGYELGHPLFVTEEARIMAFFAAVSLFTGWVLSWLHSAARGEAHAALRESEGRLVSLIESTDDLICSMDAEEHILTANQAVKRLLRQSTGGEPARSEVLIGLLLPERQAFWKEQFAQALAGQHRRFEVSTSVEGKPLVLDISLNPITGKGDRPVGVTLFGRDITARKEAEARLGELHRSLLEVSRQAGKAEIATGVLHNVGNTLNSVTVSVGLVAERSRGMRLSRVASVAALLDENAGNLFTFLTEDPRGQQLPAYIRGLSQQLSQEQQALIAEVDALQSGVDAIRAVVSMQQEHAHSVGMLEQVIVPQLIDDALRLQGASLERPGIQVRTEYASVPTVRVDRYKLLQILTNLLTNARHALEESSRTDKQLTVRVGHSPEGWLHVEVEDNGVGIPPENLSRVFTQGFTTKEAGHGFGLHLSALAALELGGSLHCRSPGRQQGAVFILELPLEAVQQEAQG
ncbi:ATP-binding protein [Hyalangium sp.]|uniref:ATP-binding protein n=1 Tax=Hyalangium sp. TaxID=2028555 RepID=UPI002D23EED2|nr:ATP-binding protein [Hyalangium sp.]HYH96520.1 ATP-binding protein [Hyalangium sp.]